MSDKSDTPRTDAFCRTPTEFNVGQEARLIPGWIDFARQLERELAAVTEERDALAAAMPSEGADAALAYAAEKTLREKAEAECERLREDAERINWLEANPRHAQIIINGETKDCVFYGISTHDLMPLRQAIDKARGKP